MVSDLLCILQDGRWHVLAVNMGQSAEVLPSGPEYVLAEVKHVCSEWRLLIENCKRFLSIAVPLPSKLLVPVGLIVENANWMVDTGSRSVE